MRPVRTTVLPLFFSLAACAAPGPSSQEPAEPVAETSSPVEATVFGAGKISTAAPEFAVSFSPDGRTVFFNRASADRSRLILMESRLRGGTWSEPEDLPFSGGSRDVDPFLSPDGSRLYFSSDRPWGSGATGFDTWWIERPTDAAGPGGEQGWGEPVRPGPPLNTEATEVFVSASRDGVLYFGSDRDGTMRVYSSVPRDGEYPEATVVPFDLNLAEGAGNPLISPDGGSLFFVSDREGGLGAADLYVTFRRADGWSPSRALKAPANSPFADFAPALFPDGTTLYFTSERPGIVQDFPPGERRPGDIFRVPLAGVLPATLH